MRDPKTKDDRNVLDNSIEQFKHNLNFAPKSNDIAKIQAISNRVKIKGGDDVEMELKGDEGKAMKTDRDDECACQHGGGCVAGVCLCPLGYAGSRCEITLDLKVSETGTLVPNHLPRNHIEIEMNASSSSTRNCALLDIGLSQRAP